MHRDRDKESIAVVGASGHTGRFVLDELARRGRRTTLIGRDLGRLAVVAADYVDSTTCTASTDDAASLDRALRGAAAVINCAGPFLDTALPVVDAAVRAGIPYLDITAEQGAVLAVLGRDRDAQRARVPVLPAAAFFGGLADILATSLLGTAGVAETIDVAVALDRWHPTQGTRATGARNTARRVVVWDGMLQPMPEPVPLGIWTFADPFGRQDVTMLPFSETVTIGHHLTVGSVASWFNVAALRDILDPSTPPPQPSDERRRSSQTFVVDVLARIDGRSLRATAFGQDIYAVSAPIVVEAMELLLAGDRGKWAGVRALGEICDGRAFLEALTRRDALRVRFESDAPPLFERAAGDRASRTPGPEPLDVSLQKEPFGS